jgi:hypothetical protein
LRSVSTIRCNINRSNRNGLFSRHNLAVNAVNQESAIPYFTHNNKTIFVVVIDLCDYPEPASKRGQLKTYTLVETQLVQTITETQPAAAV